MTEISLFERCSINAPPNFKSQMVEQRSYVICSFIPIQITKNPLDIKLIYFGPNMKGIKFKMTLFQF